MATGRIPKYLTIYHDLRRQIDDRVMRPGSKLPPQHKLASHYGVTVMTIRQALADLTKEGALAIKPGRGTFVAEHPDRVRLNHLDSFAQELERQGIVVTTRVLSNGLRVVDDEPNLRLGLTPATPVFLLERLRMVDGRPVSHQCSYLPAEIGELVASAAIGSGSLYDLLARDLRIEVCRAVETVRPTILSDDLATKLGRSPGAPALRSERLSLTEDESPILYDRATLPGDSMALTADRRVQAIRLSYTVRNP